MMRPAYHQVWLILVVILSVISAQTEEDDHTATACVGRCDFGYRMDCPRGKRVAPRDLTYHAKETSAQCPAIKQNPDVMCQSSEECCRYNGGDCSQPFSYSKAFDVFNNCSGYQNCGWFRAESVDLGNRCSHRDKTNYVSATYSCIKEETFIDICSEASRQGKSVSLLYNGSRYGGAVGDPRVCSCAITTSDCDSPARLKFRAVDLRLHSYNDITSCKPHSRVSLQDTATSQSLRCQSNYFQKGFRDVFYSSSPYARMSLYNQPGVYPTQVWLEVTATVPNIDVIVTCGSSQPENLLFCGPPLPLTSPAYEHKTSTKSSGDIFGPSGDGGEKPSPDKDNEPRETDDTVLSKKDLGLIVGAVAGLLVVILIIVIIIICIKHRRGKLRKKPPMLPHPVPLSTPSSVIPSSFPSSATEERYTEEQYGDDKYGNYYESVAQPNGSMDNKSPFTPGKAMGSFFPSDRPKIPPPAPPSIPATPPVRKFSETKLDANPYHAPWDASVFQAPNNRAKKNDLAYATSDEIQVLIQRMENERGCVSEGLNIPKPIPQKGYIYIDDYQKKDGSSKAAELYVYQDDSEDSESESDNRRVNGVNGEQSDEASTRPSQGEQGTSEGTPRSNDNFCGSEDTGYRSVGSPEHVLVSEDDYLVPGSVKSTSSKGTSSSTVKVSERGSVIYNSSYGDPCDARRSETGSNSYGEPYDAVQEKETVDVKTKF